MKKILLLVLSLWAQFSWAAIVSINTYKTPQGNELLVIGDHHSPKLDKEYGAAHAHIFHCFASLFKPHIIIESSQNNIETIRQLGNKLQHICIIDKIALSLSQSYQSSKLVLADQRTDKDQIFSNLIAQIEHVRNNKSFFQAYTEMIMDTSRELTPQRIKTLMKNEGKKITKQLKELVSTGEFKPSVAEAIKKKYAARCEIAEAFLKPMEVAKIGTGVPSNLQMEDCPFWLAYLRRALAKQSSEVTKDIDKLLYPGYIFAEVGFLREIFKSRNEKQTVCYVGQFHAKNLEGYLLSLGYELKEAQTSCQNDIIKITNHKYYAFLQKNTGYVYAPWEKQKVSIRLFFATTEGKKAMLKKTLLAQLINTGFEPIRLPLSVMKTLKVAVVNRGATATRSGT